MRGRTESLLLALVCCGVFAGYCWIATPAVPQFGLLDPGEQHFNQLVAGFRSGELSLKREPPAELAKLADPYDPKQNAAYRLHDASYYRGKYYIYYGVTPALVLFWPYVALTGHYLAQKWAVVIFCSAAFAVAAALVWRIGRRCFPGVGAGVLLAMVGALGTVNGAAFLLRRPEMYEVSTSCAYAFVMAALAAIWCSLGEGRGPVAWTALASLLLGLAVGARPTFVFGAACVIIPVAWLMQPRGGPRVGGTYGWKLGLAAFAPLAAIGVGLAAYNYARFGNPLEFGMKYLMMGQKVTRYFVLDWRYIWLNVRLYFLLPTGLMEYFPFVRGVAVPPLPAGYGFTEDTFGIFPNIPFLLLAFAAPLAWSGRDPQEARRLRLFTCAVAWVALTSVAVLLAFVVASIRYELDFTPYLAFLAVLGVLGIEDHFSRHPKGRPWARAGWAALLAASAAFNFFASCEHLGLLERQAPAAFQGLSRIFNYPLYASNHLLSSMRDRRTAAGAREGSPPRYGPLLVRIGSPPGAAGANEPLAVLGAAPGVSAIAYIRSVGADEIVVGFQFTGLGVYECRPMRPGHPGPLDIVVTAPSLYPELGDGEWGGVPYLGQLSRLGEYSIAVDGASVLEVHSLLDRTIDRGAPLLFGVNPVRDSRVSGTFSGQILEHARLGIAGVSKAPR